MGFDVSDIITDPDFSTTFQVLRVTGAFNADGIYVSGEATLEREGIVLPAKLDQLKVLPEGERNEESLAVYCVEDILMADQQNQLSDIVVYKGGFYRVAFTKYYDQCTLWYALCVRFRRAA